MKYVKSISLESQREGKYQKGQTAKDKFNNLHVLQGSRKGWLKCVVTGSEFISS